MRKLIKIVRDTRAATAIEYGLIAALVAVAGVTAMNSVGTKLSGTFKQVHAALWDGR